MNRAWAGVKGAWGNLGMQPAGSHILAAGVPWHNPEHGQHTGVLQGSLTGGMWSPDPHLEDLQLFQQQRLHAVPALLGH